MLELRADPWEPDFGMGFQVAEADPPAGVDPHVESGDWSTALTPSAPGQAPVVRFVDGVRRIDLRLQASDGGRRAPGLLGSFAVGCVEQDGRAGFGEHQVGRVLVVGGGLLGDPVTARVGRTDLTYLPVSEPGSEPDQPLRGLQQQMRLAEGVIAARAASEEGVVVVDGPLGFTDPTAGEIVGVVKRSVRTYLEQDQDALIARLQPGQRTPLFALGRGDQPIDRFSWYTRLVAQRPEWHDHAGVVRCEVREGIGLERAIGLANDVSAMLPAFAGRPSDPRAPQNLAPIGALEGWLKHRMGHAGLIRRALTVSVRKELHGRS